MAESGVSQGDTSPKITKNYAMRLLRCMVVVFCLCITAMSAMGEEYQLQIKLQEYSTQASASIDLERVMTIPSEFEKLTPGKVLFAQSINVNENQSLVQKIQIDSSEIDIDCQLGQKEKDLIPLTLSINISNVLKVVDGVPLKNTRSTNTSVECRIGEEIHLGGISNVAEGTLTLFTVKLAKKEQ